MYGARTETADLPTGTATYAGHAYAETFPANNPNRSSLNRLQARFMLDADFGASTVNATVDQIQVREAGQSSYAPAAADYHIAISNGMISNNEFTADVASSAGFQGDLIGHFYGPAAAEMGGTFNGTNSTLGTVSQGYFGGSKQ